MIKNNNRNVTMDVMKGLGVIAIVVGHAEGPLSHFIYLYHMPMFFFISGYFFNEKYTLSISGIRTLINRRVKSLYWPYLKYSLFFLALHNVFFKLHIYSEAFTYGDKIIHPYSMHDFATTFLKVLLFASREPMGAVFWFFTVLFFVNIGFGIIGYISHRIGGDNIEIIRATLVLVSFLTGNLLTYFGITIPRFNNSLVMVLVFYLGFLFEKHEDKINLDSKFLAIVCFLLLFFNSLYGAVAVNRNSYLSPDFLIVNTILGVYGNLYLSRCLVKKGYIITKYIEYIGYNSIIIIALHFLCFKIVDLIQIAVYNLPITSLGQFPFINSSGLWWIAYSAVGLIVPVIINLIGKPTLDIIKMKVSK